jgi:hypothetical protein
MKILDIPQTGKRGMVVAYQSPFGLCLRQFIVPRNTPSDARYRARRDFGKYAHAWGALLTEEQREAWNVAGPKVQSSKRLGQSGPLTGQQHFQGISSARACIGREMLLLPPEPFIFDPNPVVQLIIINDGNGVRILLKVTGPVTEDIMVFGQAPCSRGRAKRRNVSYLGLLSVPENGLCDITLLYTARFGAPPPNRKIFIVTRQQHNGWEDYDKLTAATVPEQPEAQPAISPADSAARQPGMAEKSGIPQAVSSPIPQPAQAASPEKPEASQAPAAGVLSLNPHMHKGCTRDAQGMATGQVEAIPQSAEGVQPGQHEALARSGARKAGSKGGEEGPLSKGG